MTYTATGLLNKAFKEFSNNVALILEDGTTLSYKDVKERGSRLVSLLRKKGVKDGALIAIVMDRNTDYLIASIACVLYGYGFIALDSNYPQDRIKTIIEDARPDFVVDEAFFALSKSEEISQDIDCQKIKQDSPVYVIYTSGSTGRPKGIIHNQQGIADSMLRTSKVFALKKGDIWGAVAPFTFCAVITEIFSNLIAGVAIKLIPRQVSKDPQLLADFILDNGITATYIPPRILQFFNKKGDKLHLVITGSEKICNLAPNGFRLLSLYGMSETTPCCVYFDVDKAYDNTPVGKACEGVSMYILDENDKEVQEGEICLAGNFMTGYINLPKQTANTKRPNPFSKKDGHEFIIHTRDIGRKLDDGNVLYLNRKDWMIKINGQRVEPGEIESVLKKIKGISDAAVKSFVNRYGQTYICAYYVSEYEISSDRLKAAVQEELPPYMVPSFFVCLEALPLNFNRKLDRLALKEPDASAFLTEYEEPANNVESSICQAFSKILGLERIGANDDFFALGGDSFKAVLVAKNCEEIKLSVRHVFTGKTPREIAKLAVTDTDDIEIVETDKKQMPLTDSQMGVFLDSSDSEPDCRYNIPFVFTFESSSVDVMLLKDAFDRSVRSRQAFSIRIKTEAGVPIMTKSEEYPDIEIIEAEEKQFEKIKKDFVKPFTLDNNPLYRALIVKTKLYVYLLMDVHHLVFDGTSLDVFKKVLCNEYTKGSSEREVITPFVMSASEQAFKGSEREKACLEFYKNALAGCEVDSNLNYDLNKPELSGRKGTVESTVNVDVKSVEYFTKDSGITENTLFAYAFALALAKFTCQKESLFVSVENGRHNNNMASSVGMFVRTFPVYTVIDETAKTVDTLKAFQKNLFDFINHDDISFADIVHACGIDSQVRFVYQSELINNFELNGKTVGVETIPVSEAMSNLEMMVLKQNGSYRISLGYRKSIYSQALISSFAEFYSLVVDGLVRCTSLCDINLLPLSQEKLLDEFNYTDLEYNKDQTPSDVLENNVKKYSDRIAVSFKNVNLTYSQFGNLTDRLASYINSLGLKRGDFIPVLTSRSQFMPLLAWGVVKAGCAYQPLDPTYPAERLNFMVGDSKAKLIIAQRDLASLITGFTGKIIYTDEIENLPEVKNFKADSKPDDALVLMYTSGTTGTPKGIVLSNKNVNAFVNSHIKYINIDSSASFATYAGFGFDACLMDMFSVLMAGAKLCIIPEEIRLDLKALNDFYNENRITHGFVTTQLGCMLAQSIECSTLKCLMVGGEKLIPFKPNSKFRVLNAYGPSETTVYVTHYEVKDDGPIQPIGKANYNTKLYIADSFGRRLPIGACGELLIAGPQSSHFYLNRPEKTAESFVLNRYCSEEEYRTLYKSGDIVRFLPDGNVDFIGRRDGQVKIRGFRIELTEIEQIIRKFSGIKNATVQAFEDPNGGKFVAAYITSDDTVDIDALNDFIGNEKPSYMIPAVTMQVNEIPLTPNGKVDKRKLPVPQRKAEEIIAPETQTQKKILEIVSSVLGTSEIGITTDVFKAGLTSLGAIRLNSLLSDSFGVVIQTRDLKANPTAKELEIFINGAETEEKTQIVYPDYPLTKTQEGILIECQGNPDSTIYNIPYLMKISTKLNERILKAAVLETVQAHNYINTTLFYDKDGNVRQRLASLGAFTADDIEVISVSSIDEIRDSLVVPFKLIGGRLFRIALIKTDLEFYLFMDFHHIISDGTSMLVFIADLEQAYMGSSPKEETYTGYDVALTEQKLRNGKAFLDAEDYYQNLLGGFDTDYLPKPDVHAYSKKGSGKLFFEGCTSVPQRVSEYCKKHNISENAVLCTAFGQVLALYNGTDTSMFTTVYNGRSDSRMGRTVSMLVKTLPVLFNPESATTVEYTSAMANQLVNSMSNDIYSFAEISRRFGIKNDVMFIFQGKGFEKTSFCNEDCSLVELSLSDEKSPISVQAVNTGKYYRYEIDYNPELFTEEFAASLARSVDLAVSQIPLCSKLSDISLVDEYTSGLLDSFNATEKPYDNTKTCVDILKENVKKHPDLEAVVFKDFSCTYKEFDVLTDNIAAYLASLNIGRNDFVAIITGRSQFMTISAWGVVKSGAAYLPVDASYPKERIDLMISDSGAKVVIADRSYKNLINSSYSGTVVEMESLYSLSEAKNFKADISPEDPYIIIYSSGSTGVPKGSMLPHRSLVALQRHFKKDVGSKEFGDRMASYASFGFDAGMMDMFCSLMNCDTQCIIPEEIRLDIPAMDKFFIDNKITYGFMTTQVARPFLQNTKCKTLKAFLFGGEKMVSFTPPEGVRVCNGYGPSETNSYVTLYNLKDNNPVQPIGKAVDNIKLYVIDKSGKLLPPGGCGELCIAGPQVALGYLNRPEKNAACFVSNPFCKDSAYSMLYKTGDIVRMLPDGNYDFVGRRDGQVKIRGFRIELGEVESVISSYPGVKQVTVQAFDAPTGGKFIAAYIVCDGNLDSSSLASFIKETKPSYMVPASMIQIPAMPLTTNGKVNKAKLPAPVVKTSGSGLEPSNDTEKKLCQIYASVLGLEKVYADDDFFDIGGSSISALQLVVKCTNEGFMVVYKNIFDNPTPLLLAQLIDKGSKKKEVFAPAGKEAEQYDYSAVEYNTFENLEKIKNDGIGNVVLTGATGFLGIHVLRYLLNNTSSSVCCLIRSKGNMGASERLKMLAAYYFEDDFDSFFGNRLSVVDGSFTDGNFASKLGSFEFDTIINCAANVHHFGSEEALMRDNYDGINALIDLALSRNARLIQTSTVSVAGESVNGHIPSSFVFRENNLNIGQSLENLYIRTKYLAEQAVLDACAKKGLRGKVLRFGNLMARNVDGEFQINASNSGFINRLNGFRIIGCYPFDKMDETIEFTPIDSAAKALVILSGTPDEFTIFHVYNAHSVHMANIFDIMNSLELKVDYVQPSEFGKRFEEVMHDENLADKLSGVLSYQQSASNSKNVDVHTSVRFDNAYTVKALYRLGFAWPITDNQYLYSVLKNLKDLNRFN